MFTEVKKNFGFGCMRLPMNGEEVDTDQFQKMVDEFIAEGFNYFDTAHVYIKGKSELAIKKCLTSRYPRESYVLTDKISDCFNSEEDLEGYYQTMLNACGVTYFDFVLLHAQSSRNYEKYTRCKAYEFVANKVKEGKAKHMGISFHDTPEFLDKILTDHPEIEVVQIQLNYLDVTNPNVQSKGCYDVCVKHGKKVIVMEPVKGGSLVNLPDKGKEILDAFHNGSYASYAIRYAASYPEVFMVLSGMSTYDQMVDNLSFMKDFKPLNNEEYAALDKVVDEFNKMAIIGCTGCRYCVDGCPKKIAIPDLFRIYNSKIVYHNWSADSEMVKFTSDGKGAPEDCIKCGRCEHSCPQKLPIRDILVSVAKAFQK